MSRPLPCLAGWLACLLACWRACWRACGDTARASTACAAACVAAAAGAVGATAAGSRECEGAGWCAPPLPAKGAKLTEPSPPARRYDGQVFVKPPEVLARDRLLGTYEVKPVLARLR